MRQSRKATSLAARTVSTLLSRTLRLMQSFYHRAVVRDISLRKKKPVRTISTRRLCDGGRSNCRVSTRVWCALHLMLTRPFHLRCIVPLGFLSDTTEPTPNPPTPLHDKAPGMPFGLCFMGTAYSEYQLIGYAYAFEQATHVRLTRKAFVEAIPKTQLKDVISS